MDKELQEEAKNDLPSWSVSLLLAGRSFAVTEQMMDVLWVVDDVFH